MNSADTSSVKVLYKQEDVAGPAGIAMVTTGISSSIIVTLKYPIYLVSPIWPSQQEDSHTASASFPTLNLTPLPPVEIL